MASRIGPKALRLSFAYISDAATASLEKLATFFRRKSQLVYQGIEGRTNVCLQYKNEIRTSQTTSHL